MRRIMPDSDSDSELDVDGIAQTELHKLQREFRIMVGSRQAYKAETEDIIRRQLQQIQSLQEEHKEILCNLRVIKGTRHRDKETSQDLCHMLAFQGGLETQIERERRNQKTIKQEIARLEKCIAKACERQKLLPELGRCSGQVLENKLDQRNKQCSMLLATNRKLREDLRLLHIDRNQFQHIHSKLEKVIENWRSFTVTSAM
ncbi:coiled-coil domain-containing protein 63-like [Engraulis encrasicolus]|uniref:coiled-coil domain-containing protein 63-like n=1 Tax=Engraulis encrasicolus TaxID=184585 RepID=UPI002FD5E5F0